MYRVVSPFFSPHIGTELGRAKEESRITCMRMLRTPPFFPSKSGEKPYLEVLFRFGLWRDFLRDNIQATISAFRLIKNMSINSRSVEFHQRHITTFDLFFLSHYQRERKKSLPRFVDNWKHRLGLESARAALCKWATFTRQTFLSKTFAKPLNIQKQFEKNVWKNSNDAYYLSIRVQTTISHISNFTFLCFLWQYQRQRKCFLSELRKALRDTLTRAAWLGLGNFWLVSSEHAHASYPGLFFRPPGFSPYMGREESRVQGLDYTHPSQNARINTSVVNLDSCKKLAPKQT